MNNEITIVLLGDSITQGIGSLQINYQDMLKLQLKTHGVKSNIVNLALTGTTIEYALTQIPEIEEINPDYVVIMYGSVDLQVRPNMDTNKWKILSLTPKRYKNIKGMLNPRPFMSSRMSRYILDCMDNLYRKIWKKVVIATQGTMQYLTEEEFEKNYRSVLNQLQNYKVVCSSTMYVDPQIYTSKTIENYEMVNEFLRNLKNNYSNIVGYADLYNMQMRIVAEKSSYDEIFCKDHFHPNEGGYSEISRILGELIVSDLEKKDRRNSL